MSKRDEIIRFGGWGIIYIYYYLFIYLRCEIFRKYLLRVNYVLGRLLRVGDSYCLCFVGVYNLVGYIYK